MKTEQIKKLTLTSAFFAIGLVLPFLTGQIPQIGKMLLPMHIPVFFCAFICGWKWAAPMAFVLPILRSLFFGMPAFYPDAVVMAFELAVYALVGGLIYYLLIKSKVKHIVAIYVALVISMICGRLVWGLVKYVLLLFNGSLFTFKMFMAGALINAFPGIIVQLVLIPLLMLALEKAGLLTLNRPENGNE